MDLNTHAEIYQQNKMINDVGISKVCVECEIFDKRKDDEAIFHYLIGSNERR